MEAILAWIVLILAAWGLVGLLDLLVTWIWGLRPQREAGLTMLVLVQNEADQVEGFLRTLLSLVGNGRPSTRVVVVDVASTDETAAVLERMERHERRLSVVHLPPEQASRACETAIFLCDTPVKVIVDLRGRVDREALLRQIATLWG